MPVYFAKSIAAGATRSQAFAAKSIPNFTMATLSEVPQFGKAVSTELAFSGYKDAIEAFLYATALNTRVSSQAGFYPLPEFNPSIPLPIPPITFRPRTTLKPDQVKALLQRFETSGIKQLPSGAGPQGFVVERPTWSDLNTISRLTDQNTTQPGSTIQQSAITPLRTLYKCIELFLRVNTYYYRRDEALTRLKTEPDPTENIAGLAQVILPSAQWLLSDKKRVCAPLEKDIFGTIREGQLKEEDAFKHRMQYVNGQDAVLVAKPSPKPFTASLGSTTTVPNDPGLLFPYFQGMITCDTRGLRELVGRLFFRNFGVSTDSDARKGFQEFRDNAGIIANSSMGPVIAHILKGIEVALNCQAHCYLIFDDTDYLGFALLGDHYWFHNGQQWVEPLEASALRAELQSLQTHNTTLASITGLLSLMKDQFGELIRVDDEAIQTPSGLLDHLAEVDEDQGDSVKELSKLIQGLKFKGGFKEISPQSVVWALSHLTDQADAPLTKLNLYIPLSGWSNCNSRAFQVFAAFGPRAFHFMNKRGKTISIPRSAGDVDLFNAVEENPPTRVFPRLLVYPCIIEEAVKKWCQLLETGAVTMDFDERAKGSRAIPWEGANRDLVWNKLREIAIGGHLRDTAVVAEASIGKGKKRERPAEFDDDEFAAMLV